MTPILALLVLSPVPKVEYVRFSRDHVHVDGRCFKAGKLKGERVFKNPKGCKAGKKR